MTSPSVMRESENFKGKRDVAIQVEFADICRKAWHRGLKITAKSLYGDLSRANISTTVVVLLS